MNDFADASTYDPTLLSTSGRIGRLRYLAYSAMVGLLFGAVALVLGLLSTLVWDGLKFLIVLAALVFAVLSVVLAKRRFNDLDASGWWAVAMFIPLVNLGVMIWMICFAGKGGANRYGPPPSPNTRVVKIFAALYFGLFAVGVLAAIALPAYQQYVTRANGANSDIEARY